METNFNVTDVAEQEIKLLEKELNSLYTGFLYVRQEHNNELLKQLNIKRGLLKKTEDRLLKIYNNYSLNHTILYTKWYRSRKNKLALKIQTQKSEIKNLEKELNESVNINLDEFNNRKIQDVKWKIILAKAARDNYAISGVVPVEAIQQLIQ